MIVYTEQITPRFQYILETLLSKHFDAIRFTTSADEFISSSSAKMCYAQKKFSDSEFHIQPFGLLNQEGIKTQDQNCFDWNGLKVFFKTNGDIPFDIFSAAFYLVSRYEEYLPHQKDTYGRYAHINAVAFKEDFLHLPLVDLWVDQLLILLKNKFPALSIKDTQFIFIPTYDIDIAFKYHGKGKGRTAGKIVQSIFRGDIAEVKQVRKVLSGKQADPFDVFDWLDELHVEHNMRAVYFFLLAKSRSEYDRNTSSKSAVLQKLIHRLSKKYRIGIHPSWLSYSDERLLIQEKKFLQKLIQEEVASSRQHYVQFSLPQTFRELIAAGITDDYSMGYGSINGFRASYAKSFYWYDLLKEEQTNLMLHPFCYMEANSLFEQKISVEEAAEELQQYFNIVKQVHGELITIFHNHFLTEEENCKPWRNMYAEFLQRNFNSGTKKLNREQSVQVSDTTEDD